MNIASVVTGIIILVIIGLTQGYKLDLTDSLILVFIIRLTLKLEEN